MKTGHPHRKLVGEMRFTKEIKEKLLYKNTLSRLNIKKD